MINGDNKLSFSNRIYYFVQCVLNHKKGSNFYLKSLSPKLSIQNLETYKLSPSRLLCDAFWNTIDFKFLAEQLNAKLNIIDIGCGNGNYGNFIRKIADKSFDSYTGLDIYKDEKFPSYFQHIKSKAEDAHKFLKKNHNFIMSQSTLEHIEFDFDTIKEMTRVLIENKEPFIQIHMVPSASSLWLYLWHGWRQYSRKNLSLLAERLIDYFPLNFTLIPIGSKNTFWAHFKNITLPYYTDRKIRRYGWHIRDGATDRILKSVLLDLNCNKEEMNSFWAFIISSESIKLHFKRIK